MRYSLEVVYKVCNDDTGEVIEVGPDSDGLDLTEIRTRDEKGKLNARIVLSREGLPHLIDALQRRLAEGESD